MKKKLLGSILFLSIVLSGCSNQDKGNNNDGDKEEKTFVCPEITEPYNVDTFVAWLSSLDEEHDSFSTCKIQIKGKVISSTYSSKNSTYNLSLGKSNDISVDIFGCSLGTFENSKYHDEDALKGADIVAEGYPSIFASNSYEITSGETSTGEKIKPTILSLEIEDSGGGGGEEFPDAIPSSVINNPYYKSIDWTKRGQALKEDVASCLNSQQKTLPGYDGMRDKFIRWDYDPKGSGKIIGFYDEQLVGPSWDRGDTWNREHVWPNSRGGRNTDGKPSPDADPHVIRPTSTSINSDRGNKVFGQVSGSYDPGQFILKYRGIAARIIFYTACKYWANGLILNESTGSSSVAMGKLSSLLDWNSRYGVDITETNRNTAIFNDYNLRNPFIDYPGLAKLIWQ